MIAVAKLLRVLDAAPSEAHHGCLCVIEGGALVIKAGGADGVLYHVELLQLNKRSKKKPKNTVAAQHDVVKLARKRFLPCCHLMRKGVGLPQSQLLIVEGVPEYAAHHRNVLREEEEEQESDAKFRESREVGET